MASLGTFTPPDATVDVHERVMLGTVTERALWSDTLVSESTVQVRGYQASVQPQGTGADAAAAGDDARQLLQHAVPHRRRRFSSSRPRRARRKRRTGPAPVQGRPRSARQRLRRHQRQPAVPDRAIERHAGAPSRRLGPVGADAADHRRRALCAGSRAAERALVRRVRRPRSIATASSAAGTSRRGSAPRCC